MVPTQSSMPMRAPKLQRSGTAAALIDATNFAMSEVRAVMMAPRGGEAHYAPDGVSTATAKLCHYLRRRACAYTRLACPSADLCRNDPHASSGPAAAGQGENEG